MCEQNQEWGKWRSGENERMWKNERVGKMKENGKTLKEWEIVKGLRKREGWEKWKNGKIKE